MAGRVGGDASRLYETEGYRVCSLHRSVLLGEGEVVIGRSPYCSLILDYETLSRLHASLCIVGDGVEISDLGSSNGTFVNRRRITGPTRVGPGDEIVLGKVKIWIEVAGMPRSVSTGRFTPVPREDLTKSNPEPDDPA
jgi:pSer/pThr/pTyr-binding forkhead associated (FHA) protein